MPHQLDEHLSSQPQSDVSKVPQLIKSFLLYLVSISFSFFIYYYILESSQNLPLLGERANEFLSNSNPSFNNLLIRNALAYGLLILTLLLSGYFLQRTMYRLYQGSIFRTTMTPVGFWLGLLLFSIFGNILAGEITTTHMVEVILILLFTGAWIGSLSLIISLFFHHQKKSLLLLSLTGLWFISTLLHSLYLFYSQ